MRATTCIVSCSPPTASVSFWRRRLGSYHSQLLPSGRSKPLREQSRTGASHTIFIRVVLDPSWFYLGQRPKTGVPCPFGAKNMYILKLSRKPNPRALPLVWNTLCLFVPHKAQVHPSCLFCLTSNCLLLLFSQSAIIHSSPPYAPYTNADVRGVPSTLCIPHHATPATHVSACFAAAARSSCIVGLIEPASISDARDALPSVAMAHIGIRMSYLCISAEVYRQIYTCVARMPWCGGWRVEGGRGLPVRRHSYGAHTGELCRASDWLKNDKKRLKVKLSRQLGCIWASSGRKQVQCALDQWQGS